MSSVLMALLILTSALAQAQAQARTWEESGAYNQESNDIYPIRWPIDILEREVNYELMALVDDRLQRIHNEDQRNEIRNFVVRQLRQCSGLSSSEESNCVMRATILYRQYG